MAASDLAAGPHQPNWLDPLTDSFRGHLRPLGSGPRSQQRSDLRPGFLQVRAHHLQAWRVCLSGYQRFHWCLPRLREKQSGLDASWSLWLPFRPMANKPTSSASPPRANKTQQRLLRPSTYLMLPDADVRRPQHSLYSRWPLAGSGEAARTSARVRRSTRCVRARARCFLSVAVAPVSKSLECTLESSQLPRTAPSLLRDTSCVKGYTQTLDSRVHEYDFTMNHRFTATKTP